MAAEMKEPEMRGSLATTATGFRLPSMSLKPKTTDAD